MSHDDDTTFKIPAAAEYAGISTDTIRDRIRKGHLKASRSGPYGNSHIIIRKTDLDAMMRPVPTVDAAPAPSDALPVSLATLAARLDAVEARLGSGVA